MHHKYKKVIVLIIIVLTTLSFSPANVYAEEDPESAAFMPFEELFKGKNSNVYLTEYEKNYHLDMKEVTITNLGDTGGWLLNQIANVIFSVQKGLGKIIVMVFYWSFELDVYSMFAGILNNFVDNMKTGLFDQMAVLCIALLGIFFAVKLVQDQKTQVWVAILQTAIIAAIAIYFFSNPAGVLRQVDKASKEISSVVLTGTYKATNEGATPNSAVIAASNQIWYIYVHQPWQMLEFGNISIAKQYEKQILSLPPSSDERKALIKSLAKDKRYFTAEWGAKRLGFELLYLIPLLIILVIIAILCALMIIYQFLTVFFTMFGVFVFIMALIPFFGIRIIQNWASKIIGFAGIKIIVTFCLGIMIAFITTIVEQTQDYGWIMTIVLEVAVVAGIIIKKDAIFEAFTNMRLAPGNPGLFNKQLRRDYNVEPKTNEISTKAVKGSGKLTWGAMKGVGRIFRRRKDDAEDTGEEEPRNETSGKSAKMLGTGSVKENKREDVASSKTSGNRHYSETTLSNGLQEEKSAGNDNDNFRQLLKKAEEILEQQYELQKTAAEEKAEKVNKAPEYPSFVNKVDTREKLGAPRFDQREKISVAQELDRVAKAGGKPDDLINRDAMKSEMKAANPASVMEIVVNGQKETIDRQEAYKVVTENTAKDYTNEFNQDYNKTYDPKFMEEIISKFGMQNTREMLDKMKDIRGRDGVIKNPAGYLTQSLKNKARDDTNMYNQGRNDTFENENSGSNGESV